ncbi:zinc finger and BTB domain-containing protein 17 [Biomphalaria glabrata]|nr:zinc finger and BTB domain-containing protein 17 [Biomphalaria glabrata]
MDSSQTSVSQSPSLCLTSSPPKDNVSDSSSKEKKILPGRRQQRHSTEIGSEYHRWWVVRNALGFETNEHIAGLLLDGFHGLLHQLVKMSGIETYQPQAHKASKAYGEPQDIFMDKPPSSFQSPFSASPPGVIEDMEEFIEYKDAITYYCDRLWKVYGQHENRLQDLKIESQPIQDFLLKLLSYLRTAKGKSYCLGHKKKRLKTSSTTSKTMGDLASEKIPTSTVLPSSSVPDISPKQTSSLTLLSTPSSQGLNHSDWLQGQLVQSPQTKTYQLKSISLKDIEPDVEPSQPGVLEESKEAVVSDTWNAQDTVSNGSEEIISCLNSSKEKQNNSLNLKEGTVIGFLKFKDKNLCTKEDSMDKLLTNCVSEKVKQMEEQKNDPTNKVSEDNICQFNDWENIQPGYNQIPYQTCKSNLLKRHMENMSPDSSWNLSDKQKSENDSNDSDLSNYEAIATRPQYDDEYLKSLLNKPSTLECDSDNTQNQHLCQPQNDSMNLNTRKVNSKKPEVLQDKFMGTNTSSDKDEKSRPADDDLTLNSKMPSLDYLPAFSIDLQTQTVSSTKVHPKTKFSKCNTNATSSVGTNTSDIKLNSQASKSQLCFSLSVGDPGCKPIQSCKRREINIHPVMPGSKDSLQGASPPLGTPVIFYPAHSFSSADSSLASLSSLVQNIVCNSHGAILKPLTLSPVTTSSTSFSSAPTSADSSSLHRSVSAALPVLSSQLNSGKPTLVPFYINHVNSFSEFAKFQNVPVAPSHRPFNASMPKPIKPYMPPSQLRQQKPFSQIHSTVITGHKNTLVPGTFSSSSPFQNYIPSSVPDHFTNIYDANKCHDQHVLNSSLMSPYVETQVNPPNHTLNAYNNNIFLDKPLLNPVTKASIFQNQLVYSSHHYASAIPETPVLAPTVTNFRSSDAEHFKPVPKQPQKKILTSLLSSRKVDYSGSCITKPKARNASVGQTIKASPHDSGHSLTKLTSLSTSCANISESAPQTGCTLTNISEAAPQAGCTLTTPILVSSGAKKRRDKSRSRRLVCSTCDLLFYSGTDLLVHRYEQHSHVCGECDGRFLSVARLKQHKESDHPSMMRCSHCRFHTFSKQGLLEHQRQEHDSEMDPAGGSKTEHKGNTSLTSNETVDSHSKQGQQVDNDQNLRDSNQSISLDTKKCDENICNQNTIFKHSKALKDTDNPLVSKSGMQRNESLPVFPTFSKEVVKQTSPIRSVNPMYCQVSQHCHLDLVHSVDQQCSESDEPKLIIDTDMCNSCTETVCEPAIDCTDTSTLSQNSNIVSPENYSFGMPKRKIFKRFLSIAERKNQCRLNRFRGGKADVTKRHLRNHTRTSEEMKEIFNDKNISNPMPNEPIDLSLPNALREKLVMKISFEKNANHVGDQKTRSINKLKRKKHDQDSPISNDSIKSEDNKPNNEQFDGKCQVSTSGISSNNDFPADKDCPKVTNHRLFGTKLVDQVPIDIPMVSQPGTEFIKETLSLGPLTLEPLAKEEKFLSLRDRHVMSSLPPKKRRLRKSSRTTKYDSTQLAESQTRERSGDRFINKNCNNAQESLVKQTALEISGDFLETSSINQHLCPVSRCGATFSRKWNLDGHISKVHTKLSNISCSLPGCPKTFSTKRDLRQHITMDHKGKTRKYKCSWPECTKSFFARTHLRIHNLTHTGEKPVACDICDYRCRQRTALMWHMRKHGISQKDL